MRAKVLTLALVVAIIALPVPASQLLAGTFPAPLPTLCLLQHPRPAPSRLGLLLQDPFLIDQMSYEAPQQLPRHRNRLSMRLDL